MVKVKNVHAINNLAKKHLHHKYTWPCQGKDSN